MMFPGGRSASQIHKSCESIGNVAGIIGTIIAIAIPVASYIYCLVTGLIWTI